MLEIGYSKYNKNRNKMTIIDIIDRRTLLIEFADGTQKQASSSDFTRGNVFSIYDKIYVNKKGFMGEGKYIDIEENIKAYKMWEQLLLNDEIELSEDICNFNKFATWHEDNFYVCHREGERAKVYMTIYSYEKVYDIDNIFLVPHSFIKMLEHKKYYNELMSQHNSRHDNDIKCYIFTDTNNKKLASKELQLKEEATSIITTAQLEYLEQLIHTDIYNFNDKTYEMLLYYVNTLEGEI